jgi:hypothetical protein
MTASESTPTEGERSAGSIERDSDVFSAVEVNAYEHTDVIVSSVEGEEGAALSLSLRGENINLCTFVGADRAEELAEEIAAAVE